MVDLARPVRLTDVGAILRRRWRVIALAVVALLAAGVALGLTFPATYTATSVVTVNNITVQSSGGVGNVSMTTERAVVQSREVANKVRASLKSEEDPRDLADRISVSSPTDAQVIEIAAEGDTAVHSAKVANAFAGNYLAVRRDAVKRQVDRQMNTLDNRIATLSTRLGKSKGRAAETVQTEIEGLSDRRSELLAASLDPGRVITYAAAPREKSSPPMAVFAAGGLAAGLLAGVALALIRERFDAKVRAARRLGDIIGYNVIDYRGSLSEQEMAQRIAVRLELDFDRPLTTVAIIGADPESAAVVARAFTDGLLDAGYDALFVPWSGPSLDAGPVTTVNGRVTGGRVVVISAAADVSLSKAVSLGKRVDKVVVTAARMADLRTVTELLDELHTTEAQVNAVVSVDTARLSATKLRSREDRGRSKSSKDADEDDNVVSAGPRYLDEHGR